MRDQQCDYVLKTAAERGVRMVRLWFTDVLGNLKSFAISQNELENALSDGMTFDGSSIDGFWRLGGTARCSHSTSERTGAWRRRSICTSEWPDASWSTVDRRSTNWSMPRPTTTDGCDSVWCSVVVGW